MNTTVIYGFMLTLALGLLEVKVVLAQPVMSPRPFSGEDSWPLRLAAVEAGKWVGPSGTPMSL